MSVIVVRHTIVNPRTMTVIVSATLTAYVEHLLITLRDATLAALAMLTAQRFPHHTIHTEMMFIELS